jgi:hypothetical protein
VLAPGVADPNEVVKVQVAIIRTRKTVKGHRPSEIDERLKAQTAARSCPFDYLGGGRFAPEGESRPSKGKVVCEGFIWRNGVIVPRSHQWYLRLDPKHPLPAGSYIAYVRALTRAGLGDPAIHDNGRRTSHRRPFVCRPHRC